MLYILAGLGLLFIILAFVINESNAHYLLSGYNTMSSEEQKSFNLKDYLAHFKRFHILLGVSFTLFGLAVLYILGANAAGIFLGVYPILAYIYFIYSAKKYQSPSMAKKNNWALVTLGIVLIGVLTLFLFGFEDARLEVNDKGLQISGMYGVELTYDQIQSIELIDSIPRISHRMNGFSSGEVHRGYYRTKEGEKVKLLVNSRKRPALLIVPKSGPPVFFGTSDPELESKYERMLMALNP